MTSIKKELLEREKKCNNKVVFEYDRPVINPYEYKDVKTFISENPFDENQSCKIVLPNEEYETDKYNRYYKDIYTNTRCKTANGFWVGSTVNRNNNYEKGNCWKEEEDAQCGALLHNYKLIRKKDYQD